MLNENCGESRKVPRSVRVSGARRNIQILSAAAFLLVAHPVWALEGPELVVSVQPSAGYVGARESIAGETRVPGHTFALRTEADVQGGAYGGSLRFGLRWHSANRALSVGPLVSVAYLVAPSAKLQLPEFTETGLAPGEFGISASGRAPARFGWLNIVGGVGLGFIQERLWLDLAVGLSQTRMTPADERAHFLSTTEARFAFDGSIRLRFLEAGPVALYIGVGEQVRIGIPESASYAHAFIGAELNVMREAE